MEYGDFEYGKSPTHKEYKDARSKIEEDCVLIYIKEVKDREEKVDRWIKDIKENEHTYKPFKNPDDLKNKVKDRLRNLWNKRKWEHADGKLPDIRVNVSLIVASGGRNLLGLEARNHDKNSIFLSYPKITIQNNTNYFPIILDSLLKSPVPTGELKSGDSRIVCINPNELGIDNIDQLENVIFPDKTQL